jgi:hypothetical protein
MGGAWNYPRKPADVHAISETSGALETSLGRPTPGAQIEAVQHEAEQIGWDEAELLGVKRDHTNDHAVDAGQNPSFPTPLANQDC